MKIFKLFLSFAIRIISSRLLLILLLTASGYNLFGKTVTSNGSGGGNWSDPLTWDLGVPLSTDDVVISDGDIVNVDVNETCNSLAIQADGAGIDFTQFTINSAKALTVKLDFDFQMQNGATIDFTMSGPGISQLVLSGGNFTNYTTNGTVNFLLDPASRVRYQSLGAQTIIAVNYGSLLSQPGAASSRTLDPSGTIGIAGTFTPGANSGTWTCAGSTIDFNGTGAQSIPIPLNVTFLYNNVTVSNARTTNSVTLTAGIIKIGGTFNPTATFTTGNYITTGNTVNFNSTSAQSIAAFNYNNLTISSARTVNSVTLANGGTIGVAGTFLASATFTSGGYIITNNTMDFNSTGAQTVPAFNYNSLNISAARTVNSVTLINGGTIGIAGTFNPTATFTSGAYVITNNTINFNGSGGQTIAAFNYNNLTSSSTGARTLAAAGTIGIAGTFTTGTNAYTTTGSTVDFNKAGAQTVPALPSSVNYNNINASNSGTKSLGASTGITGILTLSGTSTFDVNGKTFTLVSTVAGTASIAAIPAGTSFLGNIVMQRYAPGSPNGNDWRFLSSAVSGATIASWTDNFATSGFTGATCGPADCGNGNCAATCNYPSIYTYDETKVGVMDSGYVAATNVTNSISNGKGFWVYLGPTPVTFDVSGPPNKNAQSLSVTYTNTGSPTDDGWNVVPNPYPSAVDWNSANWTKTNINDAVYIYNSSASNGGYASYVGGASVNGGSQYIASQQAFWVQANGAAPVLSGIETVKAAAQNPTFQKTASSPNTSHFPMAFKDFPIPLSTNNIVNSIKLTSSGNGHDDEILIRFMQGATNNFDGKYDAWKLINPSPDAQNFSSVIAGNYDLSINSYPDLSSDVSIPIRLTIPAGSGVGNYSIRRDSILMLPTSSCLILEDTKTGGMINLRTTISYSFTISDTTAAPRFLLHIYAPMTKKALNATCGGGTNGMAIAKGTGTGPWNYVWKNSAGVTLKTTNGSSTADTLFNCTSGTYSVSVNGAICGNVTDTIIVNAPPVLANNISQTNVSCFGGNNGTASAFTSGGNPSYSYLWSNNETTSAVSNLSMANYSVTTTDANGCTATATVAITQPTILTNSVTQTNASCSGGANGTASAFTSGGVPSYSYLWSNNETTPTVTDLSFGNYSLMITDANGCMTTATVAITEPTAITNTVTQTNVSCFGGNNGTASVASAGGNPSYSYLWSNNQTTTSVSNLSSGNYSVLTTDANGCTVMTTAAITEPAAVTNTVTQTNVSCFGGNNGTASVASAGGNPSYSYLWSNNQTTNSISNLSSGNYSVLTTDANGCTVMTTTSITEPAVLTNTASQTNVSCFGGSDGTASVTSAGGSPAYTYLWNNGITISSESGLAAGNYSVSTTDANGCTASSQFTITQPALIVAGFNASSYTVDLTFNNTVNFINNSSGATSYQWNFGDTSAIDVTTNPAHSYSYTGTYTVTLIASDATCSDTIYKTITVINSNPTAVNGNQSGSSSVNVLYDKGDIFLLFFLDQKTQVNISVYNTIGQEIYSQNNLTVKNEKIKLDLPSVSAGMYIAVSEMVLPSDSYRITKKIIIPVSR